MSRPRYAPAHPETFGTARYAETCLRDADGALEIMLEDEGGETLAVAFDAYLAFRKMDEADAILTLEDIEESADPGTRLYSVTDSEYLRWFHFESGNLHKSQPLMHYCLTTVDSVIDVIAFDPPRLAKSKP